MYLQTPMPMKKGLGQFMLRDRIMIERIADAVQTEHPERLIVEIGPGDGALTSALLAAGHRVVGVEVDHDMVEKLKQRLGKFKNLNLITGDILKLDWELLGEEAYCAGSSGEIIVVGNLPYHLTGPILFTMFDHIRENAPPMVDRMVIMVQREVGERLTASPGNRTYGGLTLLTRYHGIAEYLFTVPADCFYPRPKVDGAVIRLIFHRLDQIPPPDVPAQVDYESFRRVVRGCFAQRRKMMRNGLKVLGSLPDGWADLNYDFTRRPEQFTFDEFVNLTRDLMSLEEGKSQ